MPMSCCMCESQETAQSLGDDTHEVVKRPKWASEHGQHTQCGRFCRWVESLAHRQVLGTWSRAEVNVRPQQAKRKNKKEREEKDTRNQDARSPFSFGS